MLNILVVEDHPPMRAALVDLLRLVFPPVDIREAASAERALEICGAHKSRLVLLDSRAPRAPVRRRLLRAADTALYKARSSGRDRVCVAAPDTPTAAAAA